MIGAGLEVGLRSNGEFGWDPMRIWNFDLSEVRGGKCGRAIAAVFLTMMVTAEPNDSERLRNVWVVHLG